MLSYSRFHTLARKTTKTTFSLTIWNMQVNKIEWNIYRCWLNTKEFIIQKRSEMGNWKPSIIILGYGKDTQVNIQSNLIQSDWMFESLFRRWLHHTMDRRLAIDWIVFMASKWIFRSTCRSLRATVLCLVWKEKTVNRRSLFWFYDTISCHAEMDRWFLCHLFNDGTEEIRVWFS